MGIDHEALIDRLKYAWKEPRAGHRYTYFGERKPMGPRHDRMPTNNPYWEIVRWMPWEKAYYGEWLPDFAVDWTFSRRTSEQLRQMGAGRDALVHQYAWSIPTPYDMTWMVRHLNGRKVVESGAGSGYWAWQLAQMHVEVAAYDPVTMGEPNRFFTDRYWVVREGDASCVTVHPNRALLLVWPRLGAPDAYEALSQYEGDMLFYAGEQDGGCTAEESFFELLETEWEYVESSPLHTTFSGIHCSLELYRRKVSKWR